MALLFCMKKKDNYIIYNEEQMNQAFIPASTFKICNSLIGLESGVIPDQNFVLHWDSIPRQVPTWNKDTNFEEAFQNSTVWYYQELATRVGEEQMAQWLKKLEYGNMDISGGITSFWLTGGLRITPLQQIDFIRRLVNNDLPLSQRSIDIFKKMMIVEQTPEYTLRAKTGWGFLNEEDIGWYVGYLENKDGTFIFSNCIQSEGTDVPDFGEARIKICRKILTDLGLIPD